MTSLATKDFPSTSDPDQAGFGCLRGPKGCLPLKAFSAHAHIAGTVYNWSIEQTYVNTTDGFIEAVYIFPLPPRAAVSAFHLRVAGRTVTGEIKERVQARHDYAEAIKDGKRAALLEEDRADVFTVQVGNIPSGEDAVVSLELSGPVAVESGECEVRMPLVVAPRYIPGSAIGGDVGTGTVGDTDAVPDASRITPPVLLQGFPNPVALDMSVSIDQRGLEVSDIACSLPTDQIGENHWRVVPGQRLNRDFILRYRVHGAEMQASALIVGDAPGGGSTLSVCLVPPEASVSRVPRDVVVVLDRSGSMGGWKMVAARRAAARMVDALDSEDSFSVLAFDNVIECPDGHDKKLRSGTDRERFRAVSYLGNLDSRGGTEMTSALKKAFKLLDNSGDGRQPILVLITDGQIGDEDRLLKSHKKALENVRVVALGIDRAVNEGLLDKITRPNGGWYACVDSGDWLDEVLAFAARQIQEPSLRDISIKATGMDEGDLTPSPVPDLYGARPLTLWARISKAAPKVNISGTLPDGEPFKTTVDVSESNCTAFHTAWARSRIRDLEDKYAAEHDAGMAKRIVEISLANKVLSRFTAFVAVDSEKQDVQDMRTITQPVEEPDGWEMKAFMTGTPMAGLPEPSAGFADSSRSITTGEFLAQKPAGIVAKRSIRPGLASMAKGRRTTAPVAPGELAAHLLAELHDGLTDALQRALCLRCDSFAEKVRNLIGDLKKAGEKETAKKLKALLKRIAPPSTIEEVAGTWDEWKSLLESVASGNVGQKAGNKREGWWR